MEKKKISGLEKFTTGIGSVASLIIHTLVFAASFLIAIFGLASWSFVLLVLTTVLSLEAIYLAIFIQMTVNRNTQSLRDVEEDIEEISEDVEEIQEDVEEISEDVEGIQEDVEELGEDVEGIQEDIEEISEDVEEIQEGVEEMSEEETQEVERKNSQKDAIATLTADVKKLLIDLEALKNKK